MTLQHLDKAPFPYFGGKRKAASVIWRALGDVEHYVEPFAGSLAVLLCRPHLANRPHHSETVNDADGLLCNAWRSIQLHPDETAEAASNPVSEADLHARHIALGRWRAEHELEHLMGDPLWCDPVMGGWWIWGLSCWIGGGWCSGTGPWSADEEGRICKGKPGVSRKRPHLADNGTGVNRADAREPGVSRQLPHLADNGQGVNHAGARETGVSRQLPHLADNGRGVNHADAREPGVGEIEYHPVTMPEVRRWFGWLSARLRHVRVLHGDFRRCLTGGASLNLSVRQGGHCGVFLDPPYSVTGAGRDDGLYTVEGTSDAAREWCLEHGEDPRYRIVLAGFEGEHDAIVAAGWREVEWFTAGFLTGGMGNIGQGGQQKRERLWLSPHCLVDSRQASLFEEDE